MYKASKKTNSTVFLGKRDSDQQFVNAFVTKNGRTVPYFAEHHLYHMDFVHETNLPFLRATQLEKLNLSQMTRWFWRGEPVPKYMKKRDFERLFRVKLTKEERVNLTCLAAFYSPNDKGTTISVIFNVEALFRIPRITHQIKQNNPDIRVNHGTKV